MQFVLGLPTDHVERVDEFATAPAIAEMAARAEELGYAGVFVTDHPAPPESFLAAGGHHALEPTVALAAAATATSRITLLTNLYIAAYRNPFLAAKAIATLDNLAQGRVVMGVGAGYLEAEFAAAGVDFTSRGEVLDDHLTVMQQAWRGDPVTAAGPGYDGAAIVSQPTPYPRPGGGPLPVWVGGNSRNALRRVVQFGHGWIPLATPKGMESFVHTAAIVTLDDLAARTAMLRSMWALEERGGEPIIAMEPWDAGRFGTERWDAALYRSRLVDLADLGVTHAPVMLSSIGRSFQLDRAGFLDLAAGFIDAVS